MIGYVTAWGAWTIVNHTTHKALNLVDDGNKVVNRIYELSNGVKVNYDGTTRQEITPGQITQDIRISSGTAGNVRFRQFRGEMGKSASLTFDAIEDAYPLYYCTAVLIAVTDISPIKLTTRTTMSIRLTWDLVSLWSITP